MPNRDVDTDLTPERLRAVLNYSRTTGLFTWKVSVARRNRVGSIAGTPHGEYIRIGLDGFFYYAHRLAWLHTKGVWPADKLDHKNGIGTDNRLKNLREATRRLNAYNKKRNHNNASKWKGVSPRSNGRSGWYAYIRYPGDKQSTNLGLYATPEEAAAVYQREAAKLHGEFYTDRGTPHS
jgi:hypothetical protein